MNARILAPLIALWSALPVCAANLDRALLSRAGQILEHLNTASINKVGVLPFRVQMGAQALSEFSPLASQLPGRLENALIVVQGDERGAIRILRSPTERDSPWRTSRAAFLRLFSNEHVPAWGSGRIKADAFLTGEITWQASQQAVQITIERLDSTCWKGDKLVPRRVASFKVDADLSLLRDLGLSLSLTSLEAPHTEAAALALALKQAAEDEKAVRPVAPRHPGNLGGLKLEVLFDDKPQPLIFTRHGFWRAPAIKEGQKLAFRVSRVDDSTARLGALLRMDGRSSYAEEDEEPLLCRKWVIPPRGKPQTFDGVYTTDNEGRLTVRRFQVLKGKAAARWVSLDVFRDGKQLEQGEDAFLSTRSQAHATARTLKELQARLLRANHLKAKGFTARGVGLRFQDIEAAIVPSSTPTEDSKLRAFLAGLTVVVPAEE